MENKELSESGALWIAREARDREEPESQSQGPAPCEATPGLASGVCQKREAEYGFFLGSPEEELAPKWGMTHDAWTEEY